MSIIIDPYFFAATAEVNLLANRFLKESGLNYFQYCSVFNDDTSFFLVTRPDFAKKRVTAKRRILSHFDKTQLNEHLYMFLWNDSLPKEDTDMAREFGLDNGLCFVERFKDHYNLIAFAAPVGSNINNFYLNNVGKLWRFICEFKDLGASVLQKAYDRRFAVPEFHSDVNREKLFLAKEQKLVASHNGVNMALSAMEFKCLQLAAAGQTLRGISAQLDISARTVETYLNRVKAKAGLATKSELIGFFHSEFATSPIHRADMQALVNADPQT